ncbi:MAG: zinc ribbon domain-containing protein [Acidobacteriota bacterium]
MRLREVVRSITTALRRHGRREDAARLVVLPEGLQAMLAGADEETAVLATRLAAEVLSSGVERYREAEALVEDWLAGGGGARPRRAERAPQFTREELIAINVNQHTGSRLIHGWFEPGKYLFLLRGTLGIPLITKLTQLGLLLDEWNGKPAGPGLLFRIKAGERRFASVLAIDLPALMTLAGASWPEVAETWRGTSYPVSEVIGMGRSESRAPAVSERTELPCPRCGKGTLVRKEKEGAYFVCEDSQCGFSVDAGADGAPLPPDRCAKCGEMRYRTMAKGKKVMKHLHPCKQARAA